MNKTSICIALLSAMYLAGCSTPAPVVVTEIKSVYKPIPKQLMKDCEVPAPIPKDQYLDKDIVDREIWLVQYNIGLLQELGICNTQLKAIRKFDKEHRKLINGEP